MSSKRRLSLRGSFICIFYIHGMVVGKALLLDCEKHTRDSGGRLCFPEAYLPQSPASAAYKSSRIYAPGALSGGTLFDLQRDAQFRFLILYILPGAVGIAVFGTYGGFQSGIIGHQRLMGHGLPCGKGRIHKSVLMDIRFCYYCCCCCICGIVVLTLFLLRVLVFPLLLLLPLDGLVLLACLRPLFYIVTK